ncbi:hypothetical protein CF326_g4812 [Tilletia indica]|nr:hypothetical protein CF326_g4812 [Tilletia indica]
MSARAAITEDSNHQRTQNAHCHPLLHGSSVHHQDMGDLQLFEGDGELGFDALEAVDHSADDADEVDSEFGDGVEPEHILDPTRHVFHEEDDSGTPCLQPQTMARPENVPDISGINIPTATYTPVQYAFMTQVLALNAFSGLSRQGAGQLFTFYNNTLQPKLPAVPIAIPLTISTVHSHLDLQAHLVRYAVCPTCEHLVLATSSQDETTRCLHCDALTHERRGKPKIIYLYQPLTSWLTWLLHQPGVFECLQEWRERDAGDVLSDVYDGQSWSNEKDRLGNNYTRTPLSLLCSLGVDWFSPFRSQYTSWHSTGAIMMTILNLPPRLRYHPSFTYLAACTPGPKEPAATRVGRYLQPLVDELCEFADGKSIRTLKRPNGQLVRLRVAFFCGDSVGRNKICGFPSHSVRKGEFCGFCEVTLSTRLDVFTTSTTSGQITQRDPEKHRADALRCAGEFPTKKAREAFERANGVHPCQLYDLPYWRSVERAPVDPMHNVELGLVKRMFHRTLIDGGSLSKSQLLVLQTALASSLVPSSEQAPDSRLGDPGGGSATAAHWSTLGRRLLVLLLYVAWQGAINEDGFVQFTPTKRSKPKRKGAKNGRSSGQHRSDARSAAAEADVGGPSTQNMPGLAATPASSLSIAQSSASADQAQGPEESSFHRGSDESDTLDAANVIPVGEPSRLRAREVLRSVAQLAAVTTLTARRNISRSEIQLLEELTRAYGRLQAELFGEKWLVYNHHIATHIPQFILRFGPAFHFSAYHFERMNGQLGKTANNGHRNGEIEATYTSAFATNARFGLLLAAGQVVVPESIQSRVPPIVPQPMLKLGPSSVLGDIGWTISLTDGRRYDLPQNLYGSLFHHIRSTWGADFPPLLHANSQTKHGIRILPRMQQHANMRLGHISLSGTSSRANANRSRTFSVVEGRSGLDLFKIDAILSHTLDATPQKHVTVYVLGSRAARHELPVFDEILRNAQVDQITRLFWVRKGAWAAPELLPAHLVSSDAALIEAGDLMGVSGGEDQRLNGEFSML